jgi:hypothetical protein
MGSEALLRHPRLGLDHGNEAANELEIAVDVALELGADHAGSCQHLAAQALDLNAAVQEVCESADGENDDYGDRDRDVARPKDRAA